MYLRDLPRLREGVARRRASTWDRTGGNLDSISIAPGKSAVIAEDDGPGCITHLWFTLLSPDLWWGRRLVLRMWWDGAEMPSVEVPLGDFFGAGNCIAGEYASAVLSIGPRDARSLHSWFPMPYSDGFRITVTNESDLPLPSLYAYVDYEWWRVPDSSLGRFHALWNRSRRRPMSVPAGGYAWPPHATDEGNHLFSAIEGRGMYVGAWLFVASEDGGWYGEGDDMIFVDSKSWPPALHGTGTEDYFGTAWSPADPFAHPFYGQPVADREDWAGFSHLYRFHLADPVPFERSLHASIERGHANDRGDDYSSVAYWYAESPAPLPAFPPVAERLPPWPEEWVATAERAHSVFRELIARDDDAARWRVGAVRIASLAYARDRLGIEAACDALVDGPRRFDDDLDVDEVLRAWVEGFDRTAAGGMDIGVAFRVRTPNGEVTRTLVVRNGRCEVREGGSRPARTTVIAGAGALAAYTRGEIGLWDAGLRGEIVIEGDSSFAFRFGVFGRSSG